MSDIFSLGTISFGFNTGPLLDGDKVLQQVAKTAEASATVIEQSMARLNAASASAFKILPAAFGGGGGGSPANVPDQDRFTSSLGRTTAALGEAAKAHQAHGAAARGSALALMEVEHVGRALFDVMASGGNVFRGLLMESGRLQIAFESGLTGAFGSIASRVVGLLNPFTIGAGALAGIGAAAALATSRVHELDLEMNRAVGGAGRFAGMSGQGLASLAAGRAADFNLSNAGLSLSDSRSSAMALARTGRLGPDSINSVMGLVPSFSGSTGTGFDKAGEGLAKIFADPAHGMSELEKAVGALDDQTRQSVTSLQARGDAEAAVKLLVDRTSTALNEMVQPQSGWSKFTTWWSNRNAQVEGMIAGETAPSPQLQYLRASRAGGSPGMLGVLQSRGLYDDSTANLAEDFRHGAMLRGGSPIMRSEGADLLANQQSQTVGDIVRSVLPDLAGRQRLSDQQAGLSKALSNPDVLEKLGPGAADAFAALDRLTTGLATFKTGLQRLVEEGDLATRQALARTASERATGDADRAYVSTLERTHSVLEAAQAAENSRNEAIASSTRTALDALRSTSDRASMVGLSPFDRILKENDLHFRDLQERTVTGPVASGRAIMMPAGGATSGFEATVNRTLGFEGGLNPHDTNGTPSNFGINAAANPGVDVANLTPAGAAQIYKSKYWNAIGADSMSPQMARVAFDTAVTEGVGRAMKLITAAGGPAGDASKLMDLREGFEGSLLSKNPAKYGPYRQSWANRDAGLRADIAGGTPGAAPGTVLDGGNATLANRVNYAAGRQADVSDLLMRGPTQTGLQLDAQSRMLGVQNEAFGKSAAMIAAAAEAQKEWNAVAADGVTQQRLQNAFGEAGVKMWDDLTAKINANAAAAGGIAKQNDDNKHIIANQDFIRDSSSSLMSAPLLALAHHQPVGRAFDNAMMGIGDSLINKGVGGITAGLFGEKGQRGGGLFGDLLGGGGKEVGSATIHAGTVTVIGGAGLPGTGGGTGDGGLGGFFSSLFHLGDSGGSGGIGHNALGTGDWRGGPTIVGEQGPELVNLPEHAQVVQHSALANMRTSAPNITIGGHQITIEGNADEKTLAIMDQKLAAANQQILDHVTRNLPQIQSDAAQYA